MGSSLNGDAVLGVRVFSATRGRDREALGEVITNWIASHHRCKVFDKIVVQSPDVTSAVIRILSDCDGTLYVQTLNSVYRIVVAVSAEPPPRQ